MAISIINTLSQEIEYPKICHYLTKVCITMKKLNQRLLLILLYIHLTGIAFSQNSTIDSLQSVLKFQKDDSNKVNTLVSLSELIFMDDKTISMPYALEALSISKKINYKPGMADAFLIIGVLHLPNYPTKALNNYYSALKLYEKLGDKNSVALALQYIGSANSSQGNDEEALKNFLASLEIRKEIGDKGLIAMSYNSIGSIYTNKGDCAKSLELHSLALKIYRELGDKGPRYGLGWSNSCIGDVYKKEGEIAIAQGDRTIAEYKFAKAQKKYLEALKDNEKIDNKAGLSAIYESLGDLNLNLKKVSNAQGYFKKSLEILKARGSKDLKNVYLGLSLIDSIKGNYNQALYHYKMYIVYRDHIINNENAQQSLMYKMQYEFEKKEALAKAEQEKKNIQEKRRKNEQYFVLFSLVLLLLFCLLIAFIQWRNNQQKQKTNVLLQQQNEKIENTLATLKATQNQLIQSEKLASLGELTAGIAHEIQNPLNFVNNFAEVSAEMIDELKEELEKGDMEEVKAIAEDLQVNLGKINHHGGRASSIVKGMLEHSRASTGVKEPTDLNALAEEFLRLAYHGLRAKDASFNCKMETHFDPDLLKVSVIPQDIGRVLLNLINNAFYAVAERSRSTVAGRSRSTVQQRASVVVTRSHADTAPYQPTVTISTQKTADKIIIKVQDNGNGIPEAIRDKIFQPFFTTKPTGQGTGLGLSLAYDIITKGHGGKLHLESIENQGSTFTIELPFTNPKN